MITRGREISENDLAVIQQLAEELTPQGRTYLSVRVAEHWDWREPSGRLKDRATRDILLRLANLGLVKLPPKKSSPALAYKIRADPEWEPYRLPNPAIQFQDDIRLIAVRDRKTQGIWNALIAKYHYLGHKTTVGRSCRYLFASADTLLGAISFTSPSWQIKSRDTILQRIGIPLSAIHDSVVNNSRFLILPTASIPYLASKALSLATRAVVIDWEEYYTIKPLVAETFVDPTRFNGTCYKAANWTDAGETAGYLKRGSSHSNSQAPKRVFVYGLTKKSGGTFDGLPQ